ncbi:MAG: Crp/Fnr family transcriptional regulator [Chitinophagaceae bacterium]
MPPIADTGLYHYLQQQKHPGLKGQITQLALKKGQQLYGTDKRHTDIYEIVSGAVKLGGISAKGEEYIYEVLTPGEFFGNLALLDDSFSEFCKTLSPVKLRAYDLSFFRHLMTHDPVVSEWFFGKIVYRWNKTESLLGYIRAYEPRERIQLLYNSMDRPVLIAPNREVPLNRLLTNKDIADLTSTTRQLVADTLK